MLSGSGVPSSGLGVNGDYYINLVEKGKKNLLDEKKQLVKIPTISIPFRISTSGSNTPSEVVMAFANLYKAMEDHGLNKDPKDE